MIGNMFMLHSSFPVVALDTRQQDETPKTVSNHLLNLSLALHEKLVSDRNTSRFRRRSFMTIPNLTAHIVNDDEIGSLCQVLSNEVYQPSCIQVLYFLLQSAIQHDVQEWDQLGPALRKSHGDSLQIATFGLAPDSHRTAEQQGGEAGLVDVWSVAILWKDEYDAGIRGRFWISSEADVTYGSSPAGKHHERERSGAHIETMCRTFFKPFLHRHSGKSIFFNGTNQRWTPVLSQNGSKAYDGICTKAARRVSLQEVPKVECPPGYRLRPLEEKDMDTVSKSVVCMYRL